MHHAWSAVLCFPFSDAGSVGISPGMGGYLAVAQATGSRNSELACRYGRHKLAGA